MDMGVWVHFDSHRLRGNEYVYCRRLCGTWIQCMPTIFIHEHTNRKHTNEAMQRTPASPTKFQICICPVNDMM